MTDLPLEISCQELQSQLAENKELLLVDCREEDEYALASIAGSRLLPMSEIQSRVYELDEWKDRPVVVHCHHGMRSGQVVTWLRQQGFSQVQNLAGGIDQWAVTINPTMNRY